MFTQNFQENENLQSFFSILSTNVAENGAHFVSTIEGYKTVSTQKQTLVLICHRVFITTNFFVAR